MPKPLWQRRLDRSVHFLAEWGGQVVGWFILAWMLMIGLDMLADDTDVRVGLGYWACLGVVLAIASVARVWYSERHR